MAKFRRQHAHASRGRGAFTGRLILVFLLIIGIVVLFIWLNRSQFLEVLNQEEASVAIPNYDNESDRYFLPSTKNGEIVHHKYYSLSYDESAEQAEWVAYFLTRSSLQAPNVPRTRRFNVDPAILTNSAAYHDYRGSGYDRGHLVPAADMAFNIEAMKETFYMSNISPQIKQFNGGIWKELEESVRDWAYKFDGLYIVSGPLYGASKKRIGQSQVLVPEYFFKVILDLESTRKKGIAFLIPNEISYLPLSKYVKSIDELEVESGFEFYDELIEDELEAGIESRSNISEWPLSTKRFDLRNTKWNKIQ